MFGTSGSAPVHTSTVSASMDAAFSAVTGLFRCIFTFGSLPSCTRKKSGMCCRISLQGELEAMRS